MMSVWVADLLDLLEIEGTDAATAWLRARGATGRGPVHLVEGSLDISEALAYAQGLLSMGLDALAADVVLETLAVAVQPEAGLSAVA